MTKTISMNPTIDLSLNIYLPNKDNPISCSLSDIKQFKNKKLIVYATFNRTSVVGFCIEPMGEDSNICAIGDIYTSTKITDSILDNIFSSITRELGYTHLIYIAFIKKFTKYENTLNISTKKYFINHRNGDYLYVGFGEIVE